MSETISPETMIEPAAELVRTAISRRRCIVGTYNKAEVKLAPHALYTRHGEPYVDAVTVERDGAKPREAKIGSFKLAGLGTVGLTTRLFSPRPDFDHADERYVGQLLCAVNA